MLKYKRKGGREGGRVRTTAEGGAPSVNEDGERRNTAKAPGEEAASGESAEREREREEKAAV